MEKKSVSLAGHRTSISLEPEFWDMVVQFAAQDGISVASFIATVDTQRVKALTPPNLASALRVYVLQRLQNTLGY